MVADPFNVKPFQVSFVGDAEELAGAHYTWECSTTYSKEDEIVSSNPVSGTQFSQALHKTLLTAA